MVQNKRRLAAIMFTDMTGYSALAHEDERLADELLIEQKSILEANVEKTQGRIIKSTGDGFLIEFSSAQNAISCALQFQSELHNRNLSNSVQRQINVRIGIHLGEVEERDGDIYGDGVNIAARIEPLASPGGIAVSSHVVEQVKRKFQIEFITLGLQNLKNIETPIEVFQLESATIQAHKHRVRSPFFTLPALRMGAAVGIVAIVIFIGWFALRSSSPGLPETPTLAVMHFVDSSPNSQFASLSSNIPIELIEVLNRLEGTRVLASSSSFTFHGANETAKTKGEKLNADFLIEGIIQVIDDLTRVNVQLIQVQNEVVMWSEIYSFDQDRTIDLLDSISSQVAQELGKEFGGRFSPPASQGTESDPAFQLYQNGWSALKEFYLRDKLDLAVEYFEAAMELDSKFAHAYAKLADVYTMYFNQGFATRQETEELARSYAERALELEPNLAEAYFSLGMISHTFDGDFETMRENFERGLELAPNNSGIHFIFSQPLFSAGHYDEALQHGLTAIELSPLSWQLRRMPAVYLMQIGRDEEAKMHLERMLELNPRATPAYDELAKIDIWNSGWEDAEQRYLDGLSIDNFGGNFNARFAYYLMHSGDFEEAREQLDESIRLSQGLTRYRFQEILLYFYQGDYIEARKKSEEYEHTVLEEARSELVYPYLGYALSYLLQEDYNSANSYANRAAELYAGYDVSTANQIDMIRGIALYRLDRNEESNRVLIRLIDRASGQNWAFSIGAILLAQADVDGFFEYMEKSFENRDPLYLSMKVNPLVDDARTDPRFSDLLAKIGLSD